MKKAACKFIVLCAVAVFVAHAHADPDGAGPDIGKRTTEGKPRSRTALPVTVGVVEDIDIANRYVILNHGPIENLNMSAMTMAFAVKDAAMLTRMNVGDKVQFTAETVGEIPTITSLKILKETRNPPR
jgi:Cu/Ag efflux protein CusF